MLWAFNAHTGGTAKLMSRMQILDAFHTADRPHDQTGKESLNFKLNLIS